MSSYVKLCYWLLRIFKTNQNLNLNDSYSAKSHEIQNCNIITVNNSK